MVAPLLVIGLAIVLAILIAWATGWTWDAAVAVFTAAMTAATMWMAWETQASRKEAAISRKRQAFKSALVELADRNQSVVRIIKGLTARGKLLREFQLRNIDPGIQYLQDYSETIGLLQQVDVPVHTSRYALGAVHKIKGLIDSNSEETGKVLEGKFDCTDQALRCLKYVHLLLVQLARVLCTEAQRQKVAKSQEWANLLEVSPFVSDLDPEGVSTAIAVYPPLGELHLPPGKEYEKLTFSELIKEARNKEPEPVDQLVGIRER